MSLVARVLWMLIKIVAIGMIGALCLYLAILTIVAPLFFICAFLVGLLARQRGRSISNWWLVSLIVSPLIAGLVLLVALPSRHRSEQTKKCPMCAEDIRIEALICRHCGTAFQAPAVPIGRVRA